MRSYFATFNLRRALIFIMADSKSRPRNTLFSEGVLKDFYLRTRNALFLEFEFDFDFARFSPFSSEFSKKIAILRLIQGQLHSGFYVSFPLVHLPAKYPSLAALSNILLLLLLLHS